MALIKMAPNRFEPSFRKVFFMMETENDRIIARCFKALYLMVIRKATLPKLAEFLKDEDSTVLFPAEVKQRGGRSFRKGINRHSHKPNFINNQARLQAKLDVEDDYLRLKSTNSIPLPTEDSPQKSSSPQSCYSQFLNKKSSSEKESRNPVIKIVEIDKQIYLKQAVKEEIRMFGVNTLQGRNEGGQSRTEGGQSQTRYDCQPTITNFGDWKRKEKEKGKVDSYSMRKTTYNEVFKLQILPKLIGNQKLNFNSGTLLKHHKSLK
jgi:hypothetical protein